MARDQYTSGHHAQFESVDGDIMIHRLAINGTIRIDELTAELARYDAPDELTFGSVNISWKIPATIDAIEEREENIRRRDRERERWERETLAKLIEKYPDAIAQIETGEVLEQEALDA